MKNHKDRAMILLRVLTLIGLFLVATCNKTIRIGFLASYSTPRLGPAIDLAIEKFQEAGGLAEYKFEIVWRTGGCSEQDGVASVLDMYLNHKVDVIMGPICSRVCIPAGYNLRYWNVPHFPAACTDPRLADKNVFRTLVRTSSGFDKLGGAVVEIMNKYGWSKVVLWYLDVFTCRYGADGIWQRLMDTNFTVEERILHDPNAAFDDDAVDNALERIRYHSRVVLFCHPISEVWRVMQRAGMKGMTGPEYVFLLFTVFPSAIGHQPWTAAPDSFSHKELDTLKSYFYSMKQIHYANLEDEDKAPMVDKVLPRLSLPPWNVNASVQGFSLEDFSASLLWLADAAFLYLTLVNETLNEGGDIRDGISLALRCRGRLFNGMTSKILIDTNSDREPDYTMKQYQPGSERFTQFAYINMADSPGQRVETRAAPFWRTEDGMPPPDSPPCGFHKELCPQDNKGHNATYISIGVIFGIIIDVSSAGIFYLYRHRKLEADLHRMLWQVQYEELDFVNRPPGSVLGLSLKSVQADNRSSHSVPSSLLVDMTGSVAFFRGLMVRVTHFPATNVTLSRNDLLELKYMKEMTHDNLNMFVGACIVHPRVCVVFAFCQKGSLEDVLENDDLKLDWTFKSSLVSDLVNGLCYLHQTALHSHGRLKSSCCYIDSRWTLKISDYGLGAFRKSDPNKDSGDFAYYRDMLWTAPELLRVDNPPAYGTQPGDVYSFGIILQEIVFRAPPYFQMTLSPQDIIERIRKGGTNAYRPEVNEGSVPKGESGLYHMMKACWEEDPNIRPASGDIKRKLRKINRGENIDIVDTMLNKLEKYATNLEELVTHRTSELLEEKKKTDILLYRMLPKSVAERLKAGEVVDAELYSEVTIYFSDIVGFTSLCSESSPMEVVKLLNELYTLFDDIIDRHDVYKVETIGDAYMVVSGIPQRTARHVCHIANLALDVVDAVKSFTIAHLPGRNISVRIGIHSGPCAAGVVGHVMPRYCLFGDTVNMASRMESTGEANKIQLSDLTYQGLVDFPDYEMEERGETNVKGKGPIKTYWLTGRSNIPSSSI